MATLLDIVKKGATNRSVTIRIIDATDGTPETGVVWDTAGIDLWYRRESGALVSVTEATLAALTTAHTDGGFLHISDGEYRLDLPDAAFATGTQHVDVGGTVTGMVVIGGRVRLVDYDPEDAVALGLSLMPANVTQLGGVAQSLTDLKDFADEGYDPATNKVQGVVLVDTLTTYTGNTLQTADHTATIADIPTVAEFNARTLVAASYFDPATDAVANVTLVATTTTNTDMVGTNSAALASVCTEGRLAELDAANLPADVDTLLGRITATLFAGITSLAEWLGLIAGKQAGNATARTEVRATGAGSGTYDETTDSNEAKRDRGDVAWVTATGFSTHDAAAVWTNGTRTLTANTNLNDPTAAVIADAVWDEGSLGHSASGTYGRHVTDILTATKVTLEDHLTDIKGTGFAKDTDSLPQCLTAVVADILTIQMSEAYAADGTAPTLAQALFLIMQSVGEFAIASTTVTVKKLDGTTTAATYTLDDATSPTSRTRAT